MHNDFVRPGGVWGPEMVPGQADFQRWDVYRTKALDGAAGGSWAPATPIRIGGAGLALTSAGSLLTGGVATQTGGRIKTNLSVPSCNARSRTIEVPILHCGLRVDLSEVTGNSQREDDYIIPTLGPIAWGIAIKGSPNYVYIDVPRRYLHSGARLATVSLSFVITQRSAALPASPMQIALLGQSYDGVFAFPNPELSTTWASGTPYAIGTYILPTTANSTGYYYESTALSGTGTSGGAEPNWPTVIGATVTDNAGPNQIVWTCKGRNGISPRKGVTPDTYYAGGAAQTLAFDFDGTHNGSFTNILDTTVSRYCLVVGNVDPTAVLTGLTLSLDTITSFQFE